MPSSYAPNYVTLEDQGKPYRPRHRSHHRGCCCLRCCCCFVSCWGCCICYLLVFIVIVLAILASLYYLVKPYVPTYNIENLDVKVFEIRNDSKVYSEITVVVKTQNPNEGVGLDYGENNVTIIYSGSQLSSGNFSPFLQPEKNTTMINVVLKGEKQIGQEDQKHFLEDQKAGKIPLLITAKIPVRLVIRDFLKLSKFTVGVNCSMVIDHLEQNKKPNILKKDFTYHIDF